MDLRQTIDGLARTPQSTVFLFALALTIVRFVVHPLLVRTAPHLRSGPYKGGKFLNEIGDSLVYAAILIFFLVRPFVFQTFTIPTGSMVPTLLVGDYIGLNKAVYRYTEPQPFDIVVFRPPARAATPDQIDAAGNVNVDFVKRLIGAPGDLVEIRSGALFRNGQRVEQPWVHYMQNVSTRIPNSQSLYKDLTPDELSQRPLASFKLVRRGGEIVPLNYTKDDANAEHPAGMLPIFDSVMPYWTPYSIAPDYVVREPAEMDRLRSAPAERVPPGHYLFMGDNRFNSFDGRGWGLVDRNAIVGRADFIWMPLSRIGKPR